MPNDLKHFWSNAKPKLKYLLLLSALLVICMCHSSSSYSPGMDEATFVRVYSDVTQKFEQVDPQQRDTFMDSVLASHHITKEKFEQTVKYYNQDPVRWQRVFTAITNEFETRLREQSTQSNSEQPDVPSTDNERMQHIPASAN
ncbi:DUF4296 domain-containing protein [candidate division KSB1 bacterium]|nr:DUF4296 domain-containing protein [candidate division KSB1 bacterium]